MNKRNPAYFDDFNRIVAMIRDRVKIVGIAKWYADIPYALFDAGQCIMAC